VNAWTTADLTPSDVTGTWAGLRPLISDARSARTADLSRRHRVITSPNGLVTVTGGKLTTYRRMAADAVDRVTDQLAGSGRGRFQRAAKRAIRFGPTRNLVLIGGDNGGRPALGVTEKAARAGLSPTALAHLTGRHGSETGELVSLCEADRTLAQPLVPGLPYIKAEAVYSARHEMAVTLADVLARRTRALILNRAASIQAAPDVAALVGAELGWDAAECDRQVSQMRAESETAALAAPVSG
jgi:glycerol-3-phosphate dehydrogenase